MEARSSQKQQGAAKSSQEQPVAARSSQEQAGAARSSQIRQEQPGAARSSQEQPGAARSRQEQPGQPKWAVVGCKCSQILFLNSKSAIFKKEIESDHFMEICWSSQEQPGGIVEETSERYLGRIWEASGSHLEEKG